MYKYNIHAKLQKLSLEDYQISWKFFPQKLNISESTWKKWIYIKKDDTREVPTTALAHIATFFECSVDDLINKQSISNLRLLFNKLKSAAL